jgi:hypothetical protein
MDIGLSTGVSGRAAPAILARSDHRRFGARADAQFGIDVIQVIIDRAGTDRKLGGDLFVAQPLHQSFQHLLLPPGKGYFTAIWDTDRQVGLPLRGAPDRQFPAQRPELPAHPGQDWLGQKCLRGEREFQPQQVPFEFQRQRYLGNALAAQSFESLLRKAKEL